MNTTLTIVAIVFVVAVLALFVYVLYEMSPYAHHADAFHGRGRQQSPHLD